MKRRIEANADNDTPEKLLKLAKLQIINKGGELVKAPRLLRMFCKFLFK